MLCVYKAKGWTHLYTDVRQTWTDTVSHGPPTRSHVLFSLARYVPVSWISQSTVEDSSVWWGVQWHDMTPTVCMMVNCVNTTVDEGSNHQSTEVNSNPLCLHMCIYTVLLRGIVDGSSLCGGGKMGTLVTDFWPEVRSATVPLNDPGQKDQPRTSIGNLLLWL